MITTSGAAPPRSSTSSYAIVLHPSTATGWLPSGGFERFDTGRKPHRSETRRFSVQRSGADGAATTSAPKLRMNRTIGPGKLRVVKTMHGSPARAAYAAAVAPAFPDEETATPRRPSARAHEIASVPSRSLNDQVGFWLSFFASRRGSPIPAPRVSHATSGVAPSPSVTAPSERRGSAES